MWNKKRIVLGLCGVIILSAVFAVHTYSHCQIPCGIYGDEMRFDMLREHITTIEKSMNQIMKLSEEDPKNMNQIVRWVQNKDDHANMFSSILHEYFLAQRIKLVEDENDEEAMEEYKHKLVLLHELIVYAMKCKQTTELDNVEKLKELVDEFYEAYFGPDHERHSHSH